MEGSIVKAVRFKVSQKGASKGRLARDGKKPPQPKVGEKEHPEKAAPVTEATAKTRGPTPPLVKELAEGARAGGKNRNLIFALWEMLY